jgi:hypothetical protein
MWEMLQYRFCRFRVDDGLSGSYNDTDHPGAIFARQLESNISITPSTESAFCDK